MAKRPKQTDPLAGTRARIRNAEKRFAPIAREQVPIDEEGFATLAELVERGMGRKVEVLRQALATGLRVMKAGSESQPVIEEQPMMSYTYAMPMPAVLPPQSTAGIPANPLVAAALGFGAETGPPIETPHSQQQGEDEEDETE